MIAGLFWIGQANINLKKKLDYLYETNQVERQCGEFTWYSYRGGGKSGRSKRLLFTYKLDSAKTNSILAWCSYRDYQACSIQNDLIEGEKICITYVEHPPKDYVFLYEIQRIK